jgi:RNA polymerase sigma-70 factor (ECF subfamily)
MTVAVERALDTARSTWPDFAIPDRVFADYILERLPEPRDPVAVSRLHISDLYLALGCLRNVPTALAALDRELVMVIAKYLGRDSSDELRQLVRERVLVTRAGKAPRLAAYTGRGALGAWLRVIAVRTALNVHRADNALRRAELGAATQVAPEADPELDFIKARYRPMFRAALEASLRALPGKRRTMLRLYFLDGLTLAKIGRLFGVHESTIALQLAAIRKQIIEHTRAELVASHGLADDEAHSLIGLLASHADLALSSVLKTQ